MTRRSYGGGSLYKDSRGYWYGQVSILGADGKRRYKRVSSKDRNTASKKLAKLQRDMRAGAVPRTSNVMVSKWLDHWLETIQGPRIRPMTYRSYSQAIRLYINPVIGKKRLDQLSPEDVRGMQRAAQEKSHRYAQLAHVVLHKALDKAEAEGLIFRNPVLKDDKPRYTPKQRKAFDAGTAKHILATALASSDEMWAARWAAAFLTGARRSELLGLTWDRVNLEEGWIDLSWQLQRLRAEHGCGEKKEGPDLEPSTGVLCKTGSSYLCGKEYPSYCPQMRWKFRPGFEAIQCEKTLWFTRPKTKAGTRVVPLIPPMVEALGRLKGMDDHFWTATNRAQGMLVFHHPDGRPIGPEEDHAAWTALLETANVPHAPLHTARHTAATLLQSAGVDEQTRMAILGHSSIAATRGYVHVDQSLTRAALGNLAQLMPGTTYRTIIGEPRG